MSLQDDLTAAAVEELDRAMTLGWRQLSASTPWGDTFEGFTPDGREVCFERAYMWEHEAGGDIRVEVTGLRAAELRGRRAPDARDQEGRE